MITDLSYIGITHDTAGGDVRDRLSLTRGQVQELLRDLSPVAQECFVLSTCERIELYTFADRFNPEPWLDILAGRIGVACANLKRHIRVMRGCGVAQHLLRVASGLESRIPFEAQVLRQVRSAFASADELGCLGPALHALCRAAICTGKRARKGRSGCAEPLSIANLALDHCLTGHDELRRPHVCVVGTGALAREIAAAASPRVAQVTIASSCHRRAVLLAQKFSCASTTIDELPHVLSMVTAVITCTACRAPVLKPGAIAGHRSNPLRIVDLGVPRNVDPAVTMHRAVRLIHLDELTAGLPDYRLSPLAEEIIRKECNRFTRWLRARAVAPQVAEAVHAHRTTMNVGGAGHGRVLHQQIERLKASVAA